MNSIHQSYSSEANCDSASQEIPYLLQNPKVYYLVHKSLQFIQSQKSPVHTITLSLNKNWD
jgi:hypothetical protein